MTIGLVVFDWAGTLVDFGCRAPLTAFLEAFADAGVPISEATARKPMGAHKRDHVREILREPAIAAQVHAHLQREPDESLVDAIYGQFERRLLPRLPAHADPVPGATGTLRWLRDRGVRVGSTTGYTRAMMDALEPMARAAGVAPEFVICADEVPQARPAPWACFRIAERCGVFPMSRAVKVGDTPADMAEGRNAGMLCVGISESGNEVGLSPDALAALTGQERADRVATAERRLRQAGADTVLRTVAELPEWLQTRAR